MDQVLTEINGSIFAVKKVADPPGTALIKEDLGIDSMQLIRIVTKLAAKLQVNIFELSDQDLASVKTVNQLADLFRK